MEDGRQGISKIAEEDGEKNDRDEEPQDTRQRV
jgi:hypothetical protein